MAESPLRKAHHFMSGVGWTRGTYQDGRDRVCILGAIWLGNLLMSPEQIDEAVLVTVEQVICEQYPQILVGEKVTKTGHNKEDNQRLAVVWNDDFCESEEQALAVLEKAAVRWDEIYG